MQLIQLQEYIAVIGFAYQQEDMNAVLEKLYEFGIFLQLEYPGKNYSAISEELKPFLSELKDSNLPSVPPCYWDMFATIRAYWFEHSTNQDKSIYNAALALNNACMVFDYLISDIPTSINDRRAEHGTIDKLPPKIDEFINDAAKLVVLRAEALVQNLENERENATQARQAELDYLILAHRTQNVLLKTCGTANYGHKEVEQIYFDILKPQIPVINQHRDHFLLRVFNKIILTIGDALTNGLVSKYRAKENKPPINSNDTTRCYRLKTKHSVIGPLPEDLKETRSYEPKEKPQKPSSAYQQIISKL